MNFGSWYSFLIALKLSSAYSVNRAICFRITDPFQIIQSVRNRRVTISLQQVIKLRFWQLPNSVHTSASSRFVQLVLHWTMAVFGGKKSMLGWNYNTVLYSCWRIDGLIATIFHWFMKIKRFLTFFGPY